MDFIALQELESEFNAQFDSVREAYAATALDADYEGYCDYCCDCDQNGEEPKSYDDYRASLRRYVSTPYVAPVYGDDEIPF